MKYGFDEWLTKEMLHAAFVPFGDIASNVMPMEMNAGNLKANSAQWRGSNSWTYLHYFSIIPINFVQLNYCSCAENKRKNKGFAFVEYEEQEDAKDAMDNMHEPELYGRLDKDLINSSSFDN